MTPLLRLPTWLTSAAFALLSLTAQAQSRTAAAWRELTLADVDAAHDIVARNHPGATAEARDPAFRRTMADALRVARARADSVTSYAGWLAVLRAFAVAFDDDHISLQPALSASAVRWPGFIVGRRGDATVVVAGDTAAGVDVPIGARLVSCDGTPLDDDARRRLGVFRGSWDAAAERVRNTPLLLVDDGNPFLAPARTCVLRDSTGRGERRIDLRWRTIAVSALQNFLRDAAPVGRPGFGVRRVGRGWWISVQSLDARVQQVLDSVSPHVDEMRAAPWVVVDVRGNGGGSSEWGNRLARLLVGEPRTSAAVSIDGAAAGADLCGESWRVSDDIEQTLQGYVRNLGPQLGPDAVREWSAQLDSVRTARRENRQLAPAPQACGNSRASSSTALPASLMQGRLVLLTDHVCFSSCLLMAGLFRTLGALQVGEGTSSGTRYMEVRGFPLPSGLGSFSTLQKVAFGIPARIGPFEPAVAFPGRIDDTAALERWIPDLVVRQPRD